MNKSFKVQITSVLAAIFLAACAYNTKEGAPAPITVSGGGGCDTTLTYKNDIKPIFDKIPAVGKSCNNAEACHGSGAQEPNLTDSALTVAYIKANNSQFIASIRFEGDQDKWMPLGGTKLPISDQKKIEDWICKILKK